MSDATSNQVQYYERLIRRGYPSGEVKAELLAKGYAEEEANAFMQQVYNNSLQKNANRSITFRIIISLVLLVLGVSLNLMMHSAAGTWFIVSGCIKIAYDLYFTNEKSKVQPLNFDEGFLPDGHRKL